MKKEQSKQLLLALGGQENVISFTRCNNHLEFTLRDVNKANQEELVKDGLVKNAKNIFSTNDKIRILVGFTKAYPDSLTLRKEIKFAGYKPFGYGKGE
jgi:phosphotransferase system IIB component